MKGLPGATIVNIQLRVNGIVFTQVHLRSVDASREEFEAVVQDPRLGIFALHEEFVLEITESGQDFVDWREVSFLELKRLVASSLGAPDVRDHREVMSLASLTAEVAGEPRPETDWGPFPWIPVKGDNSHLNRAAEALTEKCIRFRLVGGQGSGGRHWRACHLRRIGPA